MARIAKKSRSVKGVKRPKPSRTEPRKPKKKLAPPRYTIRKDSLDRRYAIDKRTGKRVSVSKATQERVRRRKAAAKVVPVFRGITPPKSAKAKAAHKKRSQAAKKGWKARRKKIKPFIVISPPKGRPPSSVEQGLLEPLIPEGMKMHNLGGIADRAEIYPKIAGAADYAWVTLQAEMAAKRIAEYEGREQPLFATPRFDRLYGKGHGTYVRSNYYARAADLEDIDQIAHTLAESEDYDYSLRELYTLYFSPEVI